MKQTKWSRFTAIRDFILGLLGVSAFASIGLFAFARPSSPWAFQEPFRTIDFVVISGGWLLAAISLAGILWRDLTPVQMSEDGLVVGRKLIPYANVESVNPMPGKLIFTMKLRSRRVVRLSKIGIESEEAFFEALMKRLSRGHDYSGHLGE